MESPANTINPDVVCQHVLQARMAAYEAKEHFEAVLKSYNDQVAGLLSLVRLMKSRIVELEQDPSCAPSSPDDAG